MNVTRAAGYCGISSRAELLKDGSLSIDRQKRAILTYLDENGYTLAGFYLEKKKPGRTGEDREQHTLLLRDAREGKFDAVVVKRPDLLSSDMFFRYWIEKELLKLDIKVISVQQTDPAEQNADDVLCRRLIEAFAGFEKTGIVRPAVTVRKIKSGATRSTDSVLTVYGWRKIGMNGKFQMVPHQEEQVHLKTMRRLRDMGWSDDQIATLLTEGGYIAETWYDRVAPRDSSKWDADMIRLAIEYKPA